MVVNPSVPARTVREFIAYAKANPGKINFASPGIGTTVHLSGELFKMMTGVDMVHVAYKGSAPSLTDLIGGQVQVSFATMPASIEFIRSGRLRALAVTTATRSPALPDVPSVGEFVPGYGVSTWYGLCARAGTPAVVIDKINNEINAALADPTMMSRLADLGGIPIAGSPGDFGKLIADETEKWAKVIRTANIKPAWRERFGSGAPDKQRFKWTTFYEAIADKLLSFHDNRAALVEGIYQISLRVEGLSYLAEDRFTDGGTGFVRDICPFTLWEFQSRYQRF